MVRLSFEQEELEGFPDVPDEAPFRVMGRLVLTEIVRTLKELTDREMVSYDEIVERLRREGW